MATAVMAPGSGISKSQEVPEWSIAKGHVRNCLDPDNSLVERCLSGDAGGWDDLVRVHTPPCVRHLLSVYRTGWGGPGSHAGGVPAGVSNFEELPRG